MPTRLYRYIYCLTMSTGTVAKRNNTDMYMSAGATAGGVDGTDEDSEAVVD